VKAAIESSLTGYTKDEEASNKTTSIYKNAVQSVEILTKNRSVIIRISSKNDDSTEEEYEEEEYEEDYSPEPDEALEEEINKLMEELPIDD